jgi:hypothetical protein
MEQEEVTAVVGEIREAAAAPSSATSTGKPAEAGFLE